MKEIIIKDKSLSRVGPQKKRRKKPAKNDFTKPRGGPRSEPGPGEQTLPNEA